METHQYLKIRHRKILKIVHENSLPIFRKYVVKLVNNQNWSMFFPALIVVATKRLKDCKT